MKTYVGVKVLTAEPCTLGEYNKRRGWQLPENEDADRPGYYVEYAIDGYKSWSPKEVFDASYVEIPEACRFEPDWIAENVKDTVQQYAAQTNESETVG
jgi:hypothetical protein